MRPLYGIKKKETLTMRMNETCTNCLTEFLEHLNIILFNMAQKYHGILSKADIASTDDVFSGIIPGEKNEIHTTSFAIAPVNP